MNVFGVGPLELGVILVVALIFVGPERLPRLAADLARTIREIRKYTGALQAEFTEYVKEVEKETAGERNEWKQIGEGIGSATQSVTDALRSVRTGIEPEVKPASPATPASESTPSAAEPTPPTTAEPEWKEIGSGLAAAPGDAPPPATNGHAHNGASASNGAAAATNGATPVAAAEPESRT